MKKLFSSKNEKGQGLIEYAIILALVAIVVIAVMRILGPKIGNTFSTINASLQIGGGAAAAAPAPYSQMCTLANYASGQTMGPFLSDRYVATLRSPWNSTLLVWGSNPGLTNPDSEFYNPTILETLPAGQTITCP